MSNLSLNWCKVEIGFEGPDHLAAQFVREASALKRRLLKLAEAGKGGMGVGGGTKASHRKPAAKSTSSASVVRTTPQSSGVGINHTRNRRRRETKRAKRAGRMEASGAGSNGSPSMEVDPPAGGQPNLAGAGRPTAGDAPAKSGRDGQRQRETLARALPAAKGDRASLEVSVTTPSKRAKKEKAGRGGSCPSGKAAIEDAASLVASVTSGVSEMAVKPVAVPEKDGGDSRDRPTVRKSTRTVWAD